MTEIREFQDSEVVAGTRYRVIRLIGVGGMGSVYEVEHIELGKRFVLKALLRELARREDLAQRLRNEWRALARLQHESIVNVTDAGTSETGVPFYVMERLDGDTLATVLRQRRRLHVLEAVHAAAAVLDALSAAHDIGIIHRDVKPANIFMVNGGGVKLLDFGIAKIADASSVVTARGLAVGTPRYMSPEQARGERVDGRSDVYSTALILFEMIAGVGPFDDARDANELVLAHLAREAPRLSSLVMGVSPELEQIVASMLAKDYRKRPAHAREVARQLRDFALRQRSAPATDAPTARADYGRGLLSATQRGTPSPLHDSTTRPEGVLRGASGRDPSASDVALTQRLAPPVATAEGTDTTLSANTGEAFTLSPSGNTTFVSPPSFDGSTTLEMSAHAPSSVVPTPAPPQSSLSTPQSASTEGVERPERTEILGEHTPALPLDAIDTRTQIPLPSLARPSSVTPPPVVDTRPGGAERTRPGQGGKRLGVFAVAALAALTVAVVVVRGQGRGTERPASVAGAVRPTPVTPATPVVAPPPAPNGEPTLAATVLSPAPVSPSSMAAAPAVALAAASAAPAAPQIPRMISGAQRLNASTFAGRTVVPAETGGPFLRSLQVKGPTAPRPAAKKAPPSPVALPGSGL